MSADDIKEMMKNWNDTEAKVRATFPNATEEEVFQTTKAAMSKSLGL